MSYSALLPAAGSGTRLGKGPKALLPLAGRSMLLRCIDAFAPHVDSIIVAVSETMRPQLPHLPAGVTVIDGGSDRQSTVARLAEACRSDYALVHDVARPFVSAEIIQRVLESLRHYSAVSVVKPISDSLVRAADGVTVDRDTLRAVQTPQGFALPLLQEVHARAQHEGHQATDDASLARRYGHPVQLITGDSWLDKITTPADYARAQALAELWNAQ